MVSPLILTLSISLDFALILFSNSEISQNYFVYSSEADSILLHRYNRTLFLEYNVSSYTTQYMIPCVDPIIKFEWPYFVNSQQMKLINGSFDPIKQLFGNHSFHLTSSFTNQTNLVIAKAAKINYEWITGTILLSLIILIESRGLIKLIQSKIRSRESLPQALFV
jgi:hypothetical protein